MSFPPLVDVHHLIPAPVRARLAASAITQVGGITVLTGTRAAGWEVHDRQGVAAAVVSLSDTGAAGGDGDLLRVLARESNQFYAELLARHPRRFGAFAVFPLRMSTPSWPVRWTSWDLTG
jgi:hypothetical protein